MGEYRRFDGLMYQSDTFTRYQGKTLKECRRFCNMGRRISYLSMCAESCVSQHLMVTTASVMGLAIENGTSCVCYLHLAYHMTQIMTTMSETQNLCLSWKRDTTKMAR